MKKLLALLALALVSVATLPVQAAATSGTFNVDINLTAACKLGAIAPVAFTYNALQSSAQTATGGGFTLQCTNGLAAPTLGLTAGATGAPGTSIVTTTDDAVGLAYTLTAPTVTAPDGTAKSYSITGSMAANQAGTCTGGAATCSNGSATNRSYTLYVTY